MIQRFRTPFLIAWVVVTCEIFLTLFLMFAGSAHTRWLGDTIQNPSDAPVYISYLEQVSRGHILLRNLYAIEPHALRFDPYWSTLGLLTRVGISPLWAYEVGRYTATIVLVFAIWFCAQSLTKNKKDRKLATILAIAGVGTGWIYTVILGAFHLWKDKMSGAPDLASEFSVAPTLISGGHMILSMALLLVGLFLIWEAFARYSIRRVLLAALTLGILFSFHPYFIPLGGIFTLIALIFHFRQLHFSRVIKLGAIMLLSLLPALAIYLPLALDPVFRTHHLVVNHLPLIPLLAWIVMLIPFGLAVLWRWHKHLVVQPQEYRLCAWIVSAILCMLLPIPWTRKYTEGLNIALVFLTLPAWIAIRDLVLSWSTPMFLKRVTLFCLLIAASLSGLNVLASQVNWSVTPIRSDYFYRSDDIFRTWDFLQKEAVPNSITTADDAWIALWTPPYTGLTTWVAHDHETPDYWEKLALWKESLSTKDAARLREILSGSHAAYLITTSDDSRARFQTLLDPSWHIVFQTGLVTVFQDVTTQKPPASI